MGFCVVDYGQIMHVGFSVVGCGQITHEGFRVIGHTRVAGADSVMHILLARHWTPMGGFSNIGGKQQVGLNSYQGTTTIRFLFGVQLALQVSGAGLLKQHTLMMTASVIEEANEVC